MATIINKTSYALRKNGERIPDDLMKRRTLKVTVVLDQVPGAFHEVEDHMRYIAQMCNYVEKIELIED